MTDLATLLDIRAIEQTYFLYCEAIDAKDFGRLAAVFSADAMQDYRSSNGILQAGVAPLIERLTRNMGHASYCGATQHNITNIRITMTAQGADAKAHFYAIHVGTGPFEGQLYSCWGQYEDRWTRTVDGWRIAERGYRNWHTEGPVAIIRGVGWEG